MTDTGRHLNVFVSFPPDAEPPNAGEWEAAIARRIPSGLAMIVVLDSIAGNLTVRSAQAVRDGSIGDIKPDAIRLLREAGFLT